MKLALLSLFILASYLQNTSASITPGKCFSVPIRDFNPTPYLGTWYEIERYNYIFEDFLKCVSATYDRLNDTAVSVYNKGFNVYE